MHMIEITNGQADIAYLYQDESSVPWHKLGQRLQEGESIEVWAKAAGLSHTVHTSPVQFVDDEGVLQMNADRNVLYRSDNKKPLGVVGNRYHVVQPKTVLQFFEKLTEHNGFTLEVAGALNGGKRIWALAKVSEGAPVYGEDVVKPYVLLATSYDGTMATTAMLTSVRVVCHNTLTMASEGGESRITVPHRNQFSIDDTRLDLGIAFNAFDRFMIESRKLAKKRVTDTFVKDFLKELLPPAVSVKTVGGVKTVTPVPVEETRGFKSIMELFQFEAMGVGMSSATGTAWGALNAVTQYVDHSMGRNADTRMSSAWFGNGNSIKDKAREMLVATL